MSKYTTRLAALLLAAFTLPACVTDDLGRSSLPIIDTPCAADADCPDGFECEIEEEHGTTTSYCQAHEDSDGSCPPGYELEIEHGQAFCKPHGGDDGGADGGADGGTLPVEEGTQECATDADCGPGLECEIEDEHGVVTSWCQPHGGV
jgi:Cys-rich repeat protein